MDYSRNVRSGAGDRGRGKRFKFEELILACDASPRGLDAVLSHIVDDGTERPVVYASRTLSAAKKNYSQVEKEGLAVVYAVKKFHNYLYGREFQIKSDHQPLSCSQVLLHHTSPSLVWTSQWGSRSVIPITVVDEYGKTFEFQFAPEVKVLAPLGYHQCSLE